MVSRSSAVLRSKINIKTADYQIKTATKTTHDSAIHHNMCNCQVDDLPTPQNTLRINTHFVLIHRLFCKCAFWGIQEGAGLQQCSAVQLRGMHGCYDFLPPKKHDHLQLYYLLYLDYLKWVTKGGVTVAHMKQ